MPEHQCDRADCAFDPVEWGETRADVKEIKKNTAEIAAHVAKQNGRIGKLERKVAVIIAAGGIVVAVIAAFEKIVSVLKAAGL